MSPQSFIPLGQIVVPNYRLIGLIAYSIALVDSLIDITNVACIKLLHSRQSVLQTSASLSFFLVNKLKPQEQQSSPFFLSHSVSNLLRNDGGSSFRKYPPLLHAWSELSSPLACTLRYPCKIEVKLCHMSFSLRLEAEDQKLANMVSHVLFPISPL